MFPARLPSRKRHIRLALFTKKSQDACAGIDRTRRVRHPGRALPPALDGVQLFSTRYYGSPMPHAIFFHKGYAIHGDRKSTRLNSSHVAISYAVFCLKKKRTPPNTSTVSGRIQ